MTSNESTVGLTDRSNLVGKAGRLLAKGSKSETGTVFVRRAPDKNDKFYFLRASPTDKLAPKNKKSIENLSRSFSAHLRIRRSYVTDMLSIYESYIFAENIMTKI